ncbi:MAG: MarR family transcriptional regulator [Planctomycetales bacterium]|nr:MarR family transcriptional regulator [Planctomycetales bacterium]
MIPYDFEASVGYWITITAHRYQQRLNEVLAPYDITFRQFQVLGWLVYEGELSQNELAERLMIEPPTLAGILDRIQRDGWIERRPCPSDRRRRIVCLTAAAQPIWRQVVDCLRAIRSEAAGDMTDEEVATLISLLRRIQKNLGNQAATVLPAATMEIQA